MKRFNKSKSYSLLEVLASVSVLILIMLGITLLSNTALRNVSAAKHRVQVSFLAQEKMEILRNMRDTGIAGASWSWDQFFNTCQAGQRFDVRYDAGSLAVPVGRYEIVPLTPTQEVQVNAQNQPAFRFFYYLECSTVGSVMFDTTLWSATTLTQRPRHFRLVSRWSEYGRQIDYTLNNYLTDLGTAP